MNKLWVWLRALWNWLSELKHFWLAVAVTGIALLISLRPGTAECTIRLSGLALQILGIGTVAWGISETRALFGRPFAANTCNQLLEQPIAACVHMARRRPGNQGTSKSGTDAPCDSITR